MKKSRRRILEQLAQKDNVLIAMLERRLDKRISKTPFRNRRIECLAREIDSLAGLERLHSTLKRRGAFDLYLEKHRWNDIDGEVREITIVRATRSEMWPMGTNYWVRDNAIVGARLLFGPSGKTQHQGKKILLSALTVMSSVTQLRRFSSIIKTSAGMSAGKDSSRWPHIFLSIDSNLNAAIDEPWSHKQDAWQMLLFFALEAIDRGLLRTSELSDKMKTFMGLAVPFLIKIKFWKSENSGSWEEIPAVRASTISWEHSLLKQIALRVDDPDFNFLPKGFTRYKRYLGREFCNRSFIDAIYRAERHVIRSMLKILPNESAQYPRTDPRYRTADAALIYLLQLNYFEHLAVFADKSRTWARKMERMVCARLDSLHDPITGGLHRYKKDSYQRNGFFRFSTVYKLNELYGAPSGDASSHQVGRHRVVPKGRMAAWSHPTWQYSAWAGRMFLRTGSAHYLRRHRELFIEGLRMVTGVNEWSIEQGSGCSVRLVKIPAFRMPECYISERTRRGRDLVFPSPHTPLNWAVVEMADAFFVRHMILNRLKTSVSPLTRGRRSS